MLSGDCSFCGTGTMFPVATVCDSCKEGIAKQQAKVRESLSTHLMLGTIR